MESNASSVCGAGVYIDLLARDAGRWDSPESVGADCRRVVAALHALPLTCCRADLVIREAILDSDRSSFGITAYLTACGANPESAALALARAIETFSGLSAVALCSVAADSRLQWESAGA